LSAVSQKPSHNFKNDARRITNWIDREKHEIEDEDGIAQHLRPRGGLIKALKLNRLFERLNPRVGRFFKVLRSAAVETLLS
jgi:hypothetical protein